MKRSFFALLVSLAAILFFGYTVFAADSSNVTILNQPVETGSLNGFVQLAIVISKWILGITGSLSLLAFIIGGFMFLLSGGSPQRVEQGKGFIKGAAIGLLIVFLSYSIINFILVRSGVVTSEGTFSNTGIGSQNWNTPPSGSAVPDEAHSTYGL